MISVLVTGGAGYLGRGILRRVQRDGLPWRITVYSRDETKQDVCHRRYPEARYVLGDVNDTERLTAAMLGHDIVIHAAAVKYIPEAETNPAECVRVNVDGARSVITAAVRAGVERVVGISTDKACRAINAYGMSKALTERLFAEASYRWGTRFQTVRYGNVVGSTGSVIPMFQRQMREDGYVTVTDPKMTRFWMSMDEAIDTILYALEPERIPGSVTIPRPKAMRLGDLAACIAGPNPYAVKVIGIRPGEKEHEDLMHASEPVRMLTGSGSQYYEIIPRAVAVDHDSEFFTEPVTCSSHTPFGGWVTPERMQEMIKDAAHV